MKTRTSTAVATAVLVCAAPMVTLMDGEPEVASQPTVIQKREGAAESPHSHVDEATSSPAAPVEAARRPSAALDDTGAEVVLDIIARNAQRTFSSQFARPAIISE